MLDLHRAVGDHADVGGGAAHVRHEQVPEAVSAGQRPRSSRPPRGPELYVFSADDFATRDEPPSLRKISNGRRVLLSRRRLSALNRNRSIAGWRNALSRADQVRRASSRSATSSQENSNGIAPSSWRG